MHPLPLSAVSGGQLLIEHSFLICTGDVCCTGLEFNVEYIFYVHENKSVINTKLMKIVLKCNEMLT